jgi:hypothetical protein
MSRPGRPIFWFSARPCFSEAHVEGPLILSPLQKRSLTTRHCCALGEADACRVTVEVLGFAFDGRGLNHVCLCCLWTHTAEINNWIAARKSGCFNAGSGLSFSPCNIVSVNLVLPVCLGNAVPIDCSFRNGLHSSRLLPPSVFPILYGILVGSWGLLHVELPVGTAHGSHPVTVHYQSP